MYYECEIELSKPMGQRLKWVRNNDSVPLDTALGSLAVSKAGAELPLRAESPQKTGTEWRVTQLQAQPVVVLVLNSVELTFRHKSPSPSRYSQIYFSVRSAGRPIDDRALLGLVSGGSDAPVASWTPSEETSPRRFLFPLMLFRESWLPVWEDRRPLYGIAANVTSLVDLDRQNQIRPKGLIELLMHSSEYSSYTEVARLDITRAFWTPGVSLDFQDFSFALPGPTVRVTVLRSLGFSGASK
jgi:hypothetical protein